MLRKMFPGLGSVITFVIAGVVFVVILGVVCNLPNLIPGF
jgi:hypothetical protein